VLGERGYAQTSLKHIADHAGMAQGLLTYYYPTKDALLVDVVAQLDDEVCGRWLGAVEGVEDPFQRISIGFDAAVEDFISEPAILRLVMDMLVVGATNEAVRVRTRALLENVIAILAAEVDRVSATLPGTPSFDRSVIDFPAAIAAAFDGIFLHAAVRDTDPRPPLAALKAMMLAFAASTTH
jgi:AcrR family transcriptional regulator